MHPINTQAVTYIVQRQTVMASALVLGCLWAYIAGRESSGRWIKRLFYGLAGLCAVLAAGSKETGLIAPVLVLLYEVYFFQDFSLAFLRRHPAARNLALVALAAGAILADRLEVWKKISFGYEIASYTPGQRLLTEPRVLFQYLGLIALPLPSQLNLDHTPRLSTSLFSPWTTLPALLGWLLLLAAALRFARDHRLESFAALWYFLGLFLESSFLPIDLMTEHRLYLPSLAVIAPLAAGPILAWPKLGRTLMGLAAVILLLVLAAFSRNRVWQDEFSLWSDVARKSPSLVRAWTTLGSWFWEKGDCDRAILNYTRAIRLQPNPLAAYPATAGASGSGAADRNFEELSRTIRSNHYLFSAYLVRGICYYRKGESDRALEDLDQAVQLNPLDFSAFLNRGMVWFTRAATTGPWPISIRPWRWSRNRWKRCMTGVSCIAPGKNPTRPSRILPGRSPWIPPRPNPSWAGPWPSARKNSMPRPSPIATMPWN